MKKLVLFALLFGSLFVSHSAAAQTYGRENVHLSDNLVVVRTPDSVKRAYSRFVELLEADGYRVVYKDLSKYPRSFYIAAKRVCPGMPEFTADINFHFYKRREGTCLNIIGYCEGPSKLNHHRIFCVDEDSNNKYTPTIYALWKEMCRAAALYPGGVLTYAKNGSNSN